MGAKTLLRVEQFERLPEIEGISYELDQGELVEVPSPSFKHNAVRDELITLLKVHLKKHRDQGLAITEQDFRLSADTVRRPDVALIGPEQQHQIVRDAGIQPFGPVLAAEVASPANALTDLIHKKQQYLDAGAQTVWIFVPPSREVYVYTAGGHPEILSTDDTLDEPSLLPGFSCVSATFLRSKLRSKRRGRFLELSCASTGHRPIFRKFMALPVCTPAVETSRIVR